MYSTFFKQKTIIFTIGIKGNIKFYKFSQKASVNQKKKQFTLLIRSKSGISPDHHKVGFKHEEEETERGQFHLHVEQDSPTENGHQTQILVFLGKLDQLADAPAHNSESNQEVQVRVDENVLFLDRVFPPSFHALLLNRLENLVVVLKGGRGLGDAHVPEKADFHEKQDDCEDEAEGAQEKGGVHGGAEDQAH